MYLNIHWIPPSGFLFGFQEGSFWRVPNYLSLISRKENWSDQIRSHNNHSHFISTVRLICLIFRNIYNSNMYDKILMHLLKKKQDENLKKKNSLPLKKENNHLPKPPFFWGGVQPYSLSWEYIKLVLHWVALANFVNLNKRRKPRYKENPQRESSFVEIKVLSVRWVKYMTNHGTMKVYS